MTLDAVPLARRIRLARARRGRRAHRQRDLPRPGRGERGRAQAVRHPGRPRQVLLRTAGIPVIWLSGRASDATAAPGRASSRSRKCSRCPARPSCPPSAPVLERRGLDWDEVAFVGDDLADLPVLRRVGLPVAVANAVAEVQGRGRRYAPAPPAATARSAKWSRRCSRRAACGPRCWSATSPSRRSVARDAGALVELGRRVLRLEARAPRRRGAARRASPARWSSWRGSRAGDRLRRGQVGARGRKLAATFTSTGTAATYLHPVDSLHGDLGIVGRATSPSS